MGNSIKRFTAGLRGALRFDREAPHAAQLGVTKSAFGQDGEAPAERQKAARNSDPNYYLKLTTLFPAEALAIYGTGTAIFGAANLAVVSVGLIVLVVLRTTANQQHDGATIDWKAVAVAIASYLLWATANDPAWLAPLSNNAATSPKTLKEYAALLGAALVVLAPVLAPSRSS